MRRMPIPHRVASFNHQGCPRGCYGVLGQISLGYPPVRGRLHTCYSPVRRSPARNVAIPSAAPRLACVKPVASVHPEPGSNSSLLLYSSLNLLYCSKSPLGRPGRVNARISFLLLKRNHRREQSLLLLHYNCSPRSSDLKKYRKHFNDLFSHKTAIFWPKSGAKVRRLFLTTKFFQHFF